MGRPFGIPVHVSPTWIIVAAFITYFFAPEFAFLGIGAGRYVVAFAFAVLLYLSVLVHELSHSVVARAFGLPVRRITLYLLGGVSEIEREPQTPFREFLVAVAGPVLSLLLALGGFGLYLVLPGPSVPSVLAAELAIANLLVGVFNLLPGLPLDGGRVLRAGIWKVTGRPGQATAAAAWAGRVLGVVIFLIPFGYAAVNRTSPYLAWVVWAALIGSFIWIGATQSLNAAKARSRLPGLAARPLARAAVTVDSDVPLAEALRRAPETANAGADGAGLVVVDSAERPVALVSSAAVEATPVERRPWVTVGTMSRMLGPGQVLSADLSGRDLVVAMQAAPAREYLLVEENGDICGVLDAADVQHVFSRR